MFVWRDYARVVRRRYRTSQPYVDFGKYVAGCSAKIAGIIQGDQRVSVHLMITVQKHAEIF
jgi:hypothetical protein